MGPEFGPQRNNIRFKVRKQEVKANAVQQLSGLRRLTEYPIFMTNS